MHIHTYWILHNFEQSSNKIYIPILYVGHIQKQSLIWWIYVQSAKKSLNYENCPWIEKKAFLKLPKKWIA